MNYSAVFESLAGKLEGRFGRFSLFAIVLTKRMETAISTSSGPAPHSQMRWAIVASAPWLGSGRMADVKALTDAIRDVGEERLLENSISRIIVIPPDSQAIRFLADLQAPSSGDFVMTRDLLLRDDWLLQDDRLARLFDDVLRVRVLRADARLAAR